MMAIDCKHIERNFRDGCLGKVIDTCKEILRCDKLSDDYRQMLLKYLGMAMVGREEFCSGIHAVTEALAMSQKPDVDLWRSLGDAFTEIDKPACAAECYSTAAAIDTPQRNYWKRKAASCRRLETSPEDIAMSQVYFRVRQNRLSVYQQVSQANKAINAKLYNPRWVGNESTFLHVLRGHSSFTPILKGYGGGYLLMHKGKGCIIDPGHGFIRNFLRCDYGFGDIHAIVVTHGHDDHVMDLPALNSVLYRANLDRHVDLYMDDTSYKAFRGHYLLASAHLRLKQPILKAGQQRRKIFDDGSDSLYMDVYPTQHKVPVLTSVARPTAGHVKKRNGVGVCFRIGFGGGKEQHLVVPSDTGWCPAIEAQYAKLQGCDVALLNISTIEDEKEWIDQITGQNRSEPPHHLKLMGVISFIQKVRPRNVLLSEKGAELDAVWHDIADAIATAFNGEINVYASDIGTTVFFDGNSIDIPNGYIGKSRS